MYIYIYIYIYMYTVYTCIHINRVRVGPFPFPVSPFPRFPVSPFPRLIRLALCCLPLSISSLDYWVFIKGGCSRRGVQWMGVV